MTPVEIDLLIQQCVYKLSEEQFCGMHGIDIESDQRNRLFWDMVKNNVILVDEYVCLSIGVSMKMFLEMLKSQHNIHITYEHVEDLLDLNKHYYSMDSVDFESVLLQVHNEKSQEIRCILFAAKRIYFHFLRYEKLFSENQNNVLVSHNNHLKTIFAEECKVWSERENAVQFKLQQAHQQIDHNIRVLRNDVVPMIEPHPINARKVRQLGLYQTTSSREWYIMCRQRCGWNIGQRKLKKGMTLIKKWDNLVGSRCILGEIKKFYEMRGNYIQVKIDLHDPSCLINVIDRIVGKQNIATLLVNENVSFLQNI